MTAIEFYDTSPIENAICAITTVPEKIIFLGDGSTMEKFDCVFRPILGERHPDTKIEYKSVNRNSLNDMVEKLSALVNEEEECLFDLTGGEDLALVAMGIVYEKYRHTGKIQMQRLNVNSGVIYDCDGDGNLNVASTPTLSVEENIKLHGGVVRYSALDEVRTRKWDMNEEFRRDIDKLWEICRKNPGRWNSSIKLLAALEGDMEKNDELDSELIVAAADAVIEDRNGYVYTLRDFLLELQDQDIIFGYHEDDEVLTFVYKNSEIKKCLAKEGTLLELKVYSTATEVKDKNGKPVFTDAMCGVFIDWDGELHDRLDDEHDTENEIDVLLMKGVMPVFISCKNGTIDGEELYKLDAVARRFGGKYVKKALIATYLGRKADSDSMKHLRQRAKDMKINFIDGVHTLDSGEFYKMLRNITSN